MKRTLLLLVATFSIAYLPAQVLDSLLINHNIFDLLSTTGPYGNTVMISQPTALRNAVQDQRTQSGAKKMQGYRIRIYNSNVQTARTVSQTVKDEFESLFPDIPAYRKFENLDFRVMVGDFRTKSDAIRFHKELSVYTQYRSSVIVREAIEFPAL